MLDKRGAVMETARAVSDLIREKNLKGAVIGGIAVVLHGYVRTTRDVDVWMNETLQEARPLLESRGFVFNKAERQFEREGVPVHLVPNEMAKPTPRRKIELEGIVTVELADLINLKLQSGMKNVARAQDIADVVGLIRERKLGSGFAAKLEKSLRAEFNKLVKAVRAK